MRKISVFFLLVVLNSTVLSEERARAVSIINLIATPERYDGSRVSVHGYFSIAPLKLYLDEGAAKRLDGASGIDVVDTSDDGKIAKSQCDKSYVRMVGWFREYGERPGLFYIKPMRIDQMHDDLECIQ